MFIISIFYLCIYLSITSKMSNCTIHNTLNNMNLIKKINKIKKKKLEYKNNLNNDDKNHKIKIIS